MCIGFFNTIRLNGRLIASTKKSPPHIDGGLLVVYLNRFQRNLRIKIRGSPLVSGALYVGR